MVNKIDLIDEELWDHYSGLPNPSWYAYKEKNEEEDIEDISDDRVVAKKPEA